MRIPKIRYDLRLPPATPLHACSAGMRHKAELIAALAGEPRLLLLDEPFANLDVEAIATVAAWLDGWRDRIILISHHGALPLAPDSEGGIGAGGVFSRYAPTSAAASTNSEILSKLM